MDEYTCAVCMKSFSKKSRLKRHFLTHTGRRPHQCTYCKKRFAQKSDLVMHVRIHTGERPFQCKICDKRFTQKIHLNVHTRVHTGERPYKCKICNKSFATKANLKSHSRVRSSIISLFSTHTSYWSTITHSTHSRTQVHSEDKSYSCAVCNLIFAQRSHLTLHMKTHRSTQPVTPQIYAKPLVQSVLPPPPSHDTEKAFCPVVPDGM